MTKPRAWAPEDEEVLTRLYLGRQPLERIARRFDTTKEAIKQKAYRMGLKRPRSMEAPKDDIASRLRVLLGEGVRSAPGRRLFSDEEVDCCLALFNRLSVEAIWAMPIHASRASH